MPVEIENRLPVRLPVPMRTRADGHRRALASPILAGITDFHPADHIARIRMPGKDPADTANFNFRSGMSQPGSTGQLR